MAPDAHRQGREARDTDMTGLPEIAPEGKCWAVRWADGRAVACFQKREHAQGFWDSGIGHDMFEGVDGGPKLLDKKKGWIASKKAEKYECGGDGCSHPSHKKAGSANWLERYAQGLGAEDDADEDIDGATEDRPVGPRTNFPFELRIDSKYQCADYMLDAMREKGLVFKEDEYSKWQKGNHSGATVWMQTAQDVMAAAMLVSESPFFAHTWSPVAGGDSIATQKYIHRELEESILQRRRDELYNELYENIDEKKSEILGEFLHSGAFNWPKLPEGRVLKIWRDYAKNGFVRDEDGIASLAQMTVDIVARMSAMNDFLGKETSSSMNEMLEDRGFHRIDADDRWSTKWTDGNRVVDFEDFFWSDNAHGSDYSMGDLQAAAILLMNSSKPEQQLTYIDRILQTVHQSSDLSLAFVEHGRKFLSTLYGD
jgi:hypothetical protein